MRGKRVGGAAEQALWAERDNMEPSASGTGGSPLPCARSGARAEQDENRDGDREGKSGTRESQTKRSTSFPALPRGSGDEGSRTPVGKNPSASSFT